MAFLNCLSVSAEHGTVNVSLHSFVFDALLFAHWRVVKGCEELLRQVEFVNGFRYGHERSPSSIGDGCARVLSTCNFTRSCGLV
ncbi:hypothetical protein [Glycomyces sp. YM15]|uniref:hypothetical protein n=1 Tax=Glycomyces sp. YM15 TaxID=2800446 RepID=UPI001963514A|nr:hypothetical protein [Glycomyces sp. YM15]